MGIYEVSFYEDLANTWIEPDEDEAIVNQRYELVNQKFENLYNFVFAYNNYILDKKDYGTGTKVSMLEAHIITDIVDFEGITVTELAKKWQKTSSAISQIIKKLLKEEYVYRVNSKDDAKFFHLFPHDKAKVFALNHKRYDNIDSVKTIKSLLKKFTPEELIIFDKVTEEYIKIMRKKKD